MRTFVILLTAAAMLGLSASADVIRLKNGDVIYADQAREADNSVVYEIGENTFSIPRSRVLRVENGVRPQTGAPSFAMPEIAPDSAPASGELLSQIVRGHEIDRGVLSAIESRGNANETAVAYYIAARSEFEAGRIPDSRRDLEMALRFNPQSPAVLNYYAAVLVRSGSPGEAITYAERAANIAPESPDILAVLGYAQFSAGHNADAIQSWKRSLALRFDPSIQKLIERAERENSVEGNYAERETGHFVLHYEGRQSSEGFREQLLSALEADYDDLSREFDSQPQSSIQVVLYTNQAFFDVTRAPTWMGALNDGKLRIPLQGLDSLTPDLARVLRHELTHSFINAITLGRCPQWLNEGIAQALEPQSLGGRAQNLAVLYKDGQEIPLNMLERGFASFNGTEARLAYDESLAAAEYMRSHYGMGDTVRLMQQIGEGQSTESSLRTVLHSDYGRMEEEVRGYVVGLGGN